MFDMAFERSSPESESAQALRNAQRPITHHCLVEAEMCKIICQGDNERIATEDIP